MHHLVPPAQPWQHFGVPILSCWSLSRRLFGLHDLKLAVDTVRELRLPFGVVINRVGIGDDRVHRFCAQEHIPVLLEIRMTGGLLKPTLGELIVEALPEYRAHFGRLWQAITREAGKGSAS